MFEKIIYKFLQKSEKIRCHVIRVGQARLAARPIRFEIRVKIKNIMGCFPKFILYISKRSLAYLLHKNYFFTG